MRNALQPVKPTRVSDERPGGVQEVARARHLTLAQVGQLEEAWRSNPAASLAELSKPSAEDEPAPVALRCAGSPHCALAVFVQAHLL